MTDTGVSRYARWSRLKRRGSARTVEDEEAEAPTKHTIRSPGQAAPVSTPTIDDMPDPATLPGGVLERNLVPPMAPLAGLEDDDLPYEAPPPEALALLTDGAADAEEEPDEQRELTPEEEEAIRGLPPIDTLTKDSDFTPFMAEKVPAFIRRQALNLLWRSDPAFAHLDGLDDYDDDFSLAKLVGKLISDSKNVSERREAGADDDRMAEEEEGVKAHNDDQERVDEDMDSAEKTDIATADGDDNKTNARLSGAVGTDADTDDTGEGEGEDEG
jgi:hypothetical protein